MILNTYVEYLILAMLLTLVDASLDKHIYEKECYNASSLFIIYDNNLEGRSNY